MSDRFEFPPDGDADKVQNIIERMGRAGWLKGTAIVTKNGFYVEFSELGYKRMKHICTVFFNAFPRFFKVEDRSSLKPGDLPISKTELALLLSNWAVIGQELQPPPFSADETILFCGFVLINVKRFCS